MNAQELARKQARGQRQAALIEELLHEPVVPLRDVIVPGRWGNMPALKVGRANVDWRSWTNLKARLIEAGFKVERVSPRAISLWPPRRLAHPLPVLPGTRYFEASWLPFPSRTDFWVINGRAVPQTVHYHITSHAVYLSPAFSALLRAEA